MINSIKEVRILGERYKFYDYIKSWSAYSIANEIKDHYIIDGLELKEGDVVIDIGAHIGMFSIFYAKNNPGVTFYAYEPCLNNYECLIKNLETNNITNIKAFNLAVTHDSRDVTINMSLDNTGSSSILTNNGNYTNTVKSVTLNDIFKEIGKDKIKILKIDCEFSEYDILYTLEEKNFKNIEYMMGEFHAMKGNTKFDSNKLLKYCLKYINKDKIKIMQITV